jgi:hypothetical protein
MRRDREVDYTSDGEHFLNACGMEVVLGQRRGAYVRPPREACGLGLSLVLSNFERNYRDSSSTMKKAGPYGWVW